MGFQHGSIRRECGAGHDIVISDLGTVDYQETWAKQADLARRRAEHEIEDQLLLLQHPPTYTAGSAPSHPIVPPMLPVVDVDRGGRITWHGPGQLIAYPIIQLADPVDVVDYVRRLEQALIATCVDFGITGVGRVKGRSGVWLPAGVVAGQLKPARKIAAIGIRVTRGVTMHGVSLNCNNGFEYYEHIVACGISDASVTSMSAELVKEVTVAQVQDTLARFIIAALDGDLELTDS